MIRMVHLLDDMAMGGVTRALSLFDDPSITALAHSRVVAMGRDAPSLDADLIVIHVPPRWSRLPFLAALRYHNPAARIVHVEHTYTRHFERGHVAARGRFRLLLRLAARLVHEVVAVSQDQADYLAEAGIARHRISTIHPWSGRFDLGAVRDKPQHGAPLALLAYGRYAPEKNFAALIEAMKAFAPHEVTLTLFGDGPEREMLRQLAAPLPHVQVHGASPEPARWLAECDAVVVPSRYEAFGLVATEARMAGRAVLVADRDGLPEQARRGGGLIAKLDTPSEIALAIGNLITKDLAAMGKAARIGVAAQHDEVIAGWKAVIGRAKVGSRRRMAGPAGV
jgi:glycosyltransferase involved in cell wall biosynthesis